MKLVGNGAILGDVSSPISCAKAFALLPAASILAAWTARQVRSQFAGFVGHGKFGVL
jgi:hypothetical protein